MSKVVVVGASGFGREALDVVEAMQRDFGSLELLGVVDDDPSQLSLRQLRERGVTYLGSTAEWLKTKPNGVGFLIGIGSPSIRMRLVEQLELGGMVPFAGAIHPTAVIGSATSIARGAVICAGVVISTNVHIGAHVHINASATIGHDATLDDFVSVNPMATIPGGVTVKSGTLVGANAVVLQEIFIGKNVTIGAGAVVTKPVPSGVVVKGVPGRW